VVHRASPSYRVSNRIGIDFANNCAAYGFPLNVPTVTVSGTIVPSGDATTGSPVSPPTGLPSSFFHDVSSAASTSPDPSGSGPTSSTTGSPGGKAKSGAVRVVNKAEVICALFSVCLTAALVA
jgi:hypothetical protein